MNQVSFENIVIGNIINKYIKQRIRTATSKVSESLYRYERENRVKKVYYPYDSISCLYKQSLELGAKVSYFIKYIHNVLIRHYFLIYCLKCKPALRNIAKDSCNDTNYRIPYCLVDHWKCKSKSLNKHISHENEGSCSKGVPEKLYPAMEVGFGEHNMP